MYRVLVLVGAALSACLSAWSIELQIEALTRYRAEDLFVATTTTDFAAEGTCVGVVDAERIDDALDGHHCTGRGTDADLSAPLRALRDALAVSAHGLYAAAARAPDDDADSATLRAVAQSVLLSTASRAPDALGAGTNFTAARRALGAVARAPVPTSCDAIYNRTRADLDADSRARARYDALLARDADAWPLRKISVDCDDGEQTPMSGAQLDLDAVGVDAHLTLLLYAHCRAQHQFAAAGLDGIFHRPIVNKEPGPTSYAWYPFPKGFERGGATGYDTKTRIYLGARFGHALYAYIPMLLVSSYLCADATVLLLAEATLAPRLEEVSVFADDWVDALRDSLVLRATSKSARAKRFAYALAGVVVSVAMWLAFVGLPWGVLRPSMGRMVCTDNGWNDDFDARWNELAVLAVQAFVLSVEGVLSSPLFDRCNRCSVDGAAPGRNVDEGGRDEDVVVPNTQGIRRVQRLLVWPLALGSGLMIAGQAVSCVRFGASWADGVMGSQTRVDPTTGAELPAFDPKVMGGIVFDQAIATSAIAVVVGLVVGAAIQRQLLRGVGCFSAVVFLCWLGLVCLFALPLLVYASLRSIFHQDDANLDCAFIPNDGFDQIACKSRYFTLLGGGALVFGTVVSITAIGLLEAVAAMARVPKRAFVDETSARSLLLKKLDKSARSSRCAGRSLPRVLSLRLK